MSSAFFHPRETSVRCVEVLARLERVLNIETLGVIRNGEPEDPVYIKSNSHQLKQA
jgi:hypothetical protein